VTKPLILAVANHKGGTGKTTTAVNLASALAERGKKVLVVDLDPQGSATDWLLEKKPAMQEGAVRLFQEDGGGAVPVASVQKGLDVLPATPDLVAVERTLSAEIGAERILEHALEPVARGYDVVILDTPPHFGILSVNAIIAAGNLLVPVEPYYTAVRGLAQIIRTVKTIQKRIKPDVRMLGVLAVKVDVRQLHVRELIDNLRKQLGKHMFRTLIRVNVRIPESASFHRPVLLYDPKSRGAEDHRALAEEVLERHDA